MNTQYFSKTILPDAENFIRCLRRQGMPKRVHFIELLWDLEIQDVLCHRFDLTKAINPANPNYEQYKQIALANFLGYDYVFGSLEDFSLPIDFVRTDDTAALTRSGGRYFLNQHCGLITSWETFEKFPWPDPANAKSAALEWYEKNLPDNMCIVAFDGYGFGHYLEHLSWLMGYETLCRALCENRELVKAIYDHIHAMSQSILKRLLEFSRVKVIWGGDDMGFRGGTLIAPDDLREFALSGHAVLAQMAHEAGRPYILHSCGKLDAIMNDLIECVGIDGKHSFEDTIENVMDAKKKYGHRISILGGIDVDFLCRATEREVRKRVRATLETCMDGGGYCLGTGNSVTNYIPIKNYLAMLDEGRNFM